MPTITGTTGTGLDTLVSLIVDDPGLNNAIGRGQIRTGARAADDMNNMIVDAIRATGVANDGTLTTSDVYDLNTYIRYNEGSQWAALHGDDDGDLETGFHLVQGDGGQTRMYGQNLIDTVADGIYHMGFATQWDRFLNEDGNANVRVETVAFWLSGLLADDLASGNLANPDVDPYVHGSTGTGLDSLIDIMGTDEGLNNRISTSQISSGVGAANVMNRLLVKAIHDTGVANDGTLTTSDVYDVNAYLRANDLERWADLHGNDEPDAETAFHLIKGDGGTSRMYGENLVDTVADGIYHAGFEIVSGRFLNEDGNANAAVETVAFWLSDLLADDLASGSLANDAVDPYVHGTTGTGLDQLVETMGQDAGLNNRISTSQISSGVSAGNVMNRLLVRAIQDTGVANDGTLTTSDLYDINAYLRENYLTKWADLHGNDEPDAETAFHLIKGDGGTSRGYGENLIDTVADGIYHAGFEIVSGRFLNEDGNANAAVQQVAYWLSDLLADDLASGNLANDAVDPYAAGTTGTGLDQLISLIANDPGLNNRIATSEITEGLMAADAMNNMIVKAIRATGVADDGSFNDTDMEDLNAYIRAHNVSKWTMLHGDDEADSETGYHLVQNDGAVTLFHGQNAANTVADSIYHMGFEIQWGRFLNEDGNANATLGQVSEWLNLLLKDDLEAGTLSSDDTSVNLARLDRHVVYDLADTLTVHDRAGYRELGNVPELALNKGTFALTFTADTPNDGDYNVLFSKDGSGYGNGDITAWITGGRLNVVLQSNNGEEAKLSSGEIRIEAGTSYDMAFSFGPDGAQLYLDGEKVDTAPGFTANLLENSQSLVIGAGTWGRSASNPTWMWDHFDGTISGFTVYDLALDRHEVAAIATSGPLPDLTPGDPTKLGALPAVRAGTGLAGKVYDRDSNFSNIDDLVSHIQEASSPTQTFNASKVDFGDSDWQSGTLRDFIGSSGKLTSGGGGTDMESIGIKLSGFVWIDEGSHLLTVRSDDGYVLKIGDKTFSSQTYGRGFEPTAKMADFAAGLYKIELYYFENSGNEGLRLELDGEVMGPEHFFRSRADYLDALADNGPMPDGGLPPTDGVSEGTTGTGLDLIVDIIGRDDGLAHRVGAEDLQMAARSADIMSNLLVEAIRITGVADDGNITTSDMYDVTDYIQMHHQDAWTLAHGDDEGDEETGFHLVQSDGAVTLLLGQNAIDTIADGIFHAGFDIKMGRYLNEDGNSNATVEQIAFRVSALLQDDLSDGTLRWSSVPKGKLDVVVNDASHTMMDKRTESLTLRGQALDVTGNRLDNTITGSGRDNILDGGDGNDKLDGGADNDTLFGGRGEDRISGGRGNDMIYGGDGADNMTGGAGADTFVFTSLADSMSSDADVIRDFMRSDRIDVSGIDANMNRSGDQAFTTHIGSGANFTEAGQYRLVKTGYGYLAEFNADGDAAADLAIKLMTTDTAADNWFIL